MEGMVFSKHFATPSNGRLLSAIKAHRKAGFVPMHPLPGGVGVGSSAQ